MQSAEISRRGYSETRDHQRLSDTRRHEPVAAALTSVRRSTQQRIPTALPGHDRTVEEALFREHLSWITAMVTTRTRRDRQDTLDVNDVVQETLLDALKAVRDGMIRDDHSLRSWLSRCADNNIKDALRLQLAQKRGKGRVGRLWDDDLSEPSLADARLQPEAIALGRELRQRINHALTGLSRRYREVIELRALRQLSFREVAGAMNLPSDNSAHALFVRARRALHQRLDDLGAA